MFRVVLSPHAVKDLKKLRSSIVFKPIKSSLLKMLENPLDGNVKRQRNFPSCEYRKRVGDYRILFDIDLIERKISIYRIIHRKDAYK